MIPELIRSKDSQLFFDSFKSSLEVVAYVNPEIRFKSGAGVIRLTVIIKAIQAKNEKIAKYKKFKSAKSYQKPDKFDLFISRAKRSIPAENPPINAARAPLELILFQKIPRRKTAAIGGAM